MNANPISDDLALSLLDVAKQAGREIMKIYARNPTAPR
jgi:hypothetical protein